MSLETNPMINDGRDDSALDAYLDVEEQAAQPSHFSAGPQKPIQALGPLIQRIWEHPAPLLAGFLLVILGTAATLIEPLLIGRAVDDVMVPPPWPGQWRALEGFAAVFFLVVFVRVISTIGQAYLFELLGQRVTHGLRNDLFEHLLGLPVAVYDKTPAGRLLTRVTNDVASLGEMFSAGFVSILSNLLLVLGILACLIRVDQRVGLIAASVFPGLIGLGVYFSARLRTAYREARSKLSALNAFLAENLMGIRVVQLFNRQELHLARFDRINQWYADAQIGTIRVFALFQPSITLFAGLSAALVIYFGGQSVRLGTLKVGMLVTLFSLVLTLFQPVRELADKWNVFLSGMASAERIFSVLGWSSETVNDRASSPLRLPLKEVRGHLVFDRVWFAYDQEHWVLRDFSAEIRAGERIGVVGHTGAGKTTLISLLMRFYEPQQGRILLDGRDIREIDLKSLRASMGVIQQEVFLFSGSLTDNLTFWQKELDFEVRKEIHGIAGRMDPRHGLDSWGLDPDDRTEGMLRERGSNLSMGERQLLAFGRALCAQPSIWILDEATANMDSGTEGRLQEALVRASRGQTTLLIAHRLATVREADSIWVLHKGVLVEQGNHSSLMEKNGLYARLYRFQQSSSESISKSVP